LEISLEWKFVTMSLLIRVRASAAVHCATKMNCIVGRTVNILIDVHVFGTAWAAMKLTVPVVS